MNQRDDEQQHGSDSDSDTDSGSASTSRGHTAAPDPTSTQRLAERGLRYGVVDPSSDAAVEAWVRAEQRGFHSPSPDAATLRSHRDVSRPQRLTGVWDDDPGNDMHAPGDTSEARAAEPVATISSWTTDLTLPGGVDIDLWAISAVTVSPTHAKRGIARALLEGELRTAANAGFAVAGLTVTEATLYGRYGFGIAALAANIEIDTARVRWSGVEPAGDIRVVDVADAPALLHDVHERARRASPGDVATFPGSWRLTLGVDSPDDPRTRARRAVRYRDESGDVTGVAVYRLTLESADFTKHTLELDHLVAANDEAASALWRFAVSMPLVATVKAPLRAVDDPVRWQLGDYRAAKVSIIDHHWLRVLDARALLAARIYAAAGHLVLSIRDTAGLADARVELEVDARGRAEARRVDAAAASGDDAAPELPIDVADLASLSLGGVPATTLARAGRLPGASARAIDVADRLFRASRAPWLSTWY